MNKILFAIFGWRWVEWKYRRMKQFLDSHLASAKAMLAEINEFMEEIKSFANYLEED